MQTHPNGLTCGRARLAGMVPLMVCTILMVHACTPPALAPDVTITVNQDGTFTPNPVSIEAGQTIQWTNLSTTDAIVQIGDPALFPNSDPCGIADNELDHAFAAADPNEFTGPTRKGVSGIFVLGDDGPGLVQLLSTETCDCELEHPACQPRQVTSLDGNSYKLCPREGAPNQLLETTWINPDVTGVILRLNWSDIQIDSVGVIEYFWDDLDREMNKAVENGKLFTLDVSAGKNGTPTWVFNDYTGTAGPGPVVPYEFKDWGSEESPPHNNCGYDMRLGSPMDTTYRRLYVDMIEALAEHVASDSRWFQALAHVKLSGANLLTSEARLPKRCYDGDEDGDLDVIGQDSCLCNSEIWAVDDDYTPEGLYEYYRVVGNAIYNAFFQRKSMGYQLIQAGFPRVESPTNFEGDSLRDQPGHWLLDPPGTTLDDINGVIQTETVLLQGHEGRFTDPFGTATDFVAGKLFVPQHSGLGLLSADDDTLDTCRQAVHVDPATQKAEFPIPDTVSGGGSGCPNRWAVDQGTLYSQIMGFQTGNPGRVDSSSLLEEPVHVGGRAPRAQGDVGGSGESTLVRSVSGLSSAHFFNSDCRAGDLLLYQPLQMRTDHGSEPGGPDRCCSVGLPGA